MECPRCGSKVKLEGGENICSICGYTWAPTFREFLEQAEIKPEIREAALKELDKIESRLKLKRAASEILKTSLDEELHRREKKPDCSEAWEEHYHSRYSPEKFFEQTLWAVLECECANRITSGLEKYHKKGGRFNFLGEFVKEEGLSESEEE